MKILIVLFSLAAALVRAQTGSPTMSAEETFQREGRFTTITVMLGNPIKIFVAGKERARLDTKQLKLEVRPSSATEWEELKFNSYGNYYSVKNPAIGSEPKLLEVRATIKKKSETYIIPVNPAP